ncbi:MAG: hypothetical protein LHW48_07755 [Candidatus Cloacimonetes bacterium]|jgi:hypothetical protein|nr:hypothetical protein [Candidatus Cloacimonadota bacterium]
MGALRKVLKADPTDWLLEKNNPSVRYAALTNILENPVDNNELQAAKQQLMETGIVFNMLQRQRESDYVQAYPRYYAYKYKGLVWSLITLA